MKKIMIALTTVAAFTGSASAADLAARPYTKAPEPVAPVYNWTGFYIFGGAGGGLWAADSNANHPTLFGSATRDQRLGGSGWYGTVGAGYDWQFNSTWVAGIFADGQFGSLRGSVSDSFLTSEGPEKLRTSWAAGVRLGYLVAPNVLSYVNGGYSGSEWSAASYTDLTVASPVLATTPSFHRDGWFIGGGVENSLNIFGISSPGWFMKTEYRAAFYNRVTLPETFTPASTGFGVNTESVTFKPWVQTISTSLVYRFNWTGPVVAKGSALAADLAARPYTKAPEPVAPAYNWTGFYIFGGAGGGLWNADSNANHPSVGEVTRDQRLGGSGWYGTVGAGYDWQFNSSWVAGILADGQFGSLRGSISDIFFGLEGSEKLRTSWAAGVRLGYLVAPNVLSYVNGGYSGSEWSGAGYTSLLQPTAVFDTTPSFHRDGWFVGGGVENSLNIFGISSPGWFMKTEYRAAYYNRVTLPQTFTPAFPGLGGTTTDSVTFKPWVQTISTSLVYRFNWIGPVVAKY